MLAPDQSEIRELLALSGGSMVHCTLPVGRVSLAVTPRTVEEIWYTLSGRAEFWRKRGDVESVVEVGPGHCLTIPLGAHFQFRTVGDEPFTAIMITMPPWPGPDEAIRVPDHWEVPARTDS